MFLARPQAHLVVFRFLPAGHQVHAETAMRDAVDRTLVGSYATVAKMLDECATVSATKGIMLTGQRIQPLMKTRQAKLKAVA